MRIDPYYIVQVDRDDGPQPWKYSIFKCTRFGAVRVPLPNHRTSRRITAWLIACWYLARLRRTGDRP